TKPFDEAACEQTALTKFDKSASKLTLCSPCLKPASLDAMRDHVRRSIRIRAGQVYAHGTELIGGGIVGLVRGDARAMRCTDQLAGWTAKLAKAVVKCSGKAQLESVKGASFDQASCAAPAKLILSPGLSCGPGFSGVGSLADDVVADFNEVRGFAFCQGST